MFLIIITLIFFLLHTRKSRYLKKDRITLKFMKNFFCRWIFLYAYSKSIKKVHKWMCVCGYYVYLYVCVCECIYQMD